MPLPSPVEREALHCRVIELFGYRRVDQLWDVEAHLIDSKSNIHVSPWGEEVPPGDPLHDMWLRLTIDSSFKIRALEVASDRNPYPACSEATTAFTRLVGLRIGPGWKKKVKEHVRGVAGCIHLAELLGSMASVMFQTVLPFLYEKERTLHNEPRPGLVDSCYAYRRNGEVVRRLWPNLPVE